MGGVFISYRREDTAAWAGRIYDRLAQVMGPENVFLDVDNIQPGFDFVHVLTESVGGCDALVAVIGRRWLLSADENNRRRLDDPNDFVRIEIEVALERGVRVIPVLVDGGAMPKSKDLPETLKKLARKQGIEISHTHFDSDVKRLTRALSWEKKLLKAASHSEVRPGAANAIPASPKETQKGPPQNVNVLTPDIELLFSPKGSGTGLVPKLQIGRSGVFVAGPSDRIGTLLFPALTESQFKVESIRGRVKVSSAIPSFFRGPKCNWRLALRCDNSRITSPEARVRGSELSRKRSRHAQCGTLGPSVRPL